MSARIRPRQHVNPLTQHHLQPIEVPDWRTVYARLDRPFWIDVGVARGRFILEMARLEPNWNFLGLEIRRPLVAEALRRRDRAGLTNLHYMYANANVHMEPILSSLPPASVRRVSFLFPDPWPKKRHAKRRVIQKPLLDTLARYLPPGAEIWIATDVRELFAYSDELIRAHPGFERLPTPDANPFPVSSEREVACQRLGRPVYRGLYRRVSDAVGLNG